MLANMLILFDAEAYNRYSHALISNPLIYVAEAGLVVLLATHVILTIQLTLRNNAAKPVNYKVAAAGAKKTSMISKTMKYQGALILAFIILHLITFKFGTWYDVTYKDGTTMRDLHRLVIEVFQDPAYVAGYIVVLLLVGFHLKHGVASAFDSLGVSNEKTRPLLKAGAVFYALIVAGGFISQPIYVYFFAG